MQSLPSSVTNIPSLKDLCAKFEVLSSAMGERHCKYDVNARTIGIYLMFRGACFIREIDRVADNLVVVSDLSFPRDRSDSWRPFRSKARSIAQSPYSVLDKYSSQSAIIISSSFLRFSRLVISLPVTFSFRWIVNSPKRSILSFETKFASNVDLRRVACSLSGLWKGKLITKVEPGDYRKDDKKIIVSG